ncbi:hypothetical protein GW17_00053868 [Ensete ventricosum]|nr:hypothetical protein GW17_00053868 [Ensete ventricosum]
MEEEVQKHEEEIADEEQQPIDFMMHTLAGYAYPQMTKIGRLLKQQPITVLIDTMSTNNFMNDKIWKLVGNTPINRWKKTIRLTARISEVAGLAGVLHCVLLLMFEVLLFSFWFFNRIYHEKLPFFTAMVAAPKFIVMAT